MLPISSLFPAVSHASQTIIVEIVLNQQTKGNFFVSLTDDGDILVKADDLLKMGFTGPFPKQVEIGNEPHVSLASFSGVAFVYNEPKLMLEMTSSPTLLAKQVLDFAPVQPANVYYPRDSSAFFNYRIDYSTGDSFGFQGVTASSELGIRNGNLLMLSDALYTKQQGVSDRFVRLFSSLVYDRRPDMQRFIAGDFTASSGNLGAGVILGGFSLSKLYRMNPYVLNHPTFGLSGLVSLPSNLEVYHDGTRIRTDRLSPGEFELRNITGYGGASQVEVVIRDSFGREQRIMAPFYFTDIVLKKGLHEYSYNVGALRRDFGVASNRYDGPAASGFHQYGISDALTVGFRGEWSRKAFNLGPQASFLMANAGTVTVSLSGSGNDSGHAGIAGLFAYGYQGRMINSRVFIKGFSTDYATINTSTSLPKTRYEAATGAGYTSREFGSINLDFYASQVYQGESTRAFIASYSRTLIGNLNLYASYKRQLDPVAGNEFFVGFTYYPGKQVSLSANYLRSGATNTEILQVQKNPPFGEGIGFRSTLERTDGSNLSLNKINPSVQYNGRYGVYGAEYTWHDTNGGSSSSSHLFASGAIAYAGATLGFTRPVSDSFALVKVGDVPGVMVNMNNQEIGRTDSSGKVFVPELASFNDNQVSFTDKDVPIDYLLSSRLHYISPPYRSGSCVVFKVTPLQAFTGVVSIKSGEVTKPLEFYEIVMHIDGRPLVFQTGSGGEFYLDNSMAMAPATSSRELGCASLDKAGAPLILPGRYKATVISYQGKTCDFEIEVPASIAPIIDVGRITCETPSVAEPPPTSLPAAK